MTIKLFDDLVGTSGTDLTAHTPDTDDVGGGWANDSASTQVITLDGAGNAQWSASAAEYSLDVGITDQKITLPFTAGGADNRILIGGRSEPYNHANALQNRYAFNLRVDSPSVGTATYRINKVNAGVETVLASNTRAYTNSNDVTLICVIQGSTLEFYDGATLVVSTTDSSVTAGTHIGIYGAKRTDANGRIRSVQVEDFVTTVQNDSNIKWSLIHSIQNNSDLRWSLLNALQNDSSALWSLISGVQNDSDIQWSVIQAIQNNSNFKWSLVNAVQNDSDFRWSLINAIQNDSTLAWSLIQSVQNDSDLRWSLLSEILNDTTLQWNVNTTGTSVFNDMTVQWSMLAEVYQSLTNQWSLINEVISDSNLKWSLLNTITKDLSNQWDIVQAIQNGSTIQWSVIAEVNGDMTLQWTVGNTTSTLTHKGRIYVIQSENRVYSINGESRVYPIQ